MFKSLYVLILFVCVSLIEPEIAWTPDYKLQWSDFQGPPNSDSDAAATTASGITFGYRMSETDGQITQFTADVTAHFYPEKSWYKPDEVSNHILEHEQLHFDITELHTRKLRQQISELQVSNSVNIALDSLHKNILLELKIMQNTYDAACDYSRNKEEQDVWQQKISSQLQDLNAFIKTE
jgi:hypothetical protein